MQAKGCLLFLVFVATFVAADELLVVLLDTSGSMEGQEASMVEGTNAILANMSNTLLRANWTGSFNVQIYTFANSARTLLLENQLTNHIEISIDQYVCGGGTPLYDVLGDTLNTIRDNSTIIIATDGEDTTSQHYDADTIKQMINKAREERDIHFVYVYKNDDAFTGGVGLGLAGPPGLPGPAGTFSVSGPSHMNLGEYLNAIPVSATTGAMFRHLNLAEE